MEEACIYSKHSQIHDSSVATFTQIILCRLAVDVSSIFSHFLSSSCYSRSLTLNLFRYFPVFEYALGVVVLVGLGVCVFG